MSNLVLGLVACTSAVFGILFNGYIVLVLLYNRQLRTANNLLLLHLALVDILSSLELLSMTTPTAISAPPWGNGIGGSMEYEPVCMAHGFVWTALLPVVVWTLCGLNCDRYAAIASPLHYSRLVRSRRILVFLGLTWLGGVGLAVPPLFHINPYAYQPARAACMADFTDSAAGPWYSATYTTLALLLPAFLILFCNVRILVIARHHRHRIVSAIYEVTVRAQATITHQRNPFYLSKYKGRCAIVTIVQLVGSLLLLYGPHCGLLVWEITASRVGPPTLVSAAMGLITCSPLLNGFVYGVKSRVLRKTFKNFLRRQLYTSEVHNEIQRRGSVANHGWSSVLLRIHKNNNVLVAAPFKPVKSSPEASPLTHAGAAGLGLALGIGLSISNASDSSPTNSSDKGLPLPVIGVSMPSLQGSEEDICGSLSTDHMTGVEQVTSYRQLPMNDDRCRCTSNGDVLPEICICGTAYERDNDGSRLLANGQNAFGHQLRKSLEILTRKNGFTHRRSPSCGLHLELLQTVTKDLRTVKVLPSAFVERGSI